MSTLESLREMCDRFAHQIERLIEERDEAYAMGFRLLRPSPEFDELAHYIAENEKRITAIEITINLLLTAVSTRVDTVRFTRKTK